MTVDRFEGSTPRPWHTSVDALVDAADGRAVAGFERYMDAAKAVYAVNLMDAWQAVAEAGEVLKQGPLRYILAEYAKHNPDDRPAILRVNDQIADLCAALARLAEAEKENT